MIVTTRSRTLSLLFVWCIAGSLALYSMAFVGNNASAGAFSGSISDGQTLKYDISVSSTLMPITVLVYWTTFGDDINLYLRDPNGVLVESAESTLDFGESLVYSPSSTGTYQLEVYGADINSASTISFTGSCTFHQISLHTTAGGLDWILIVAIIVIVVVVALVVVLLLIRKKPAYQAPPPVFGAQQPAQQYGYPPTTQQYMYQPPQQQYAPQPVQQYPPMQPQTPQSCPYCGTPLDSNWLVCPKCGARLR